MPPMPDEEYVQRLEQFRSASCGERLWVIYQETLPPLSAIKGCTKVLQQIDSTQVQGLPDNFSEILERISAAERMISVVLNTVALPEGREKFDKT